MLAIKLPMLEDDLTVEAQAFVAKETGKRGVMIGEEVVGGELGSRSYNISLIARQHAT